MHRSAENVEYNGEWLDDAKHGQGTQVWPSGTEESESPCDTYVGAWLIGQRGGAGKMSYANGDSYDGSWGPGGDSGVRAGQGKCIYANGDVYEGSWEEDVRSGMGEPGQHERDV